MQKYDNNSLIFSRSESLTRNVGLSHIQPANQHLKHLISLCFLAGAVLGAWAAPRFANHSLWIAEPLLIAVALHCRHSTPPISQTSADPH